VTAQVSDRSPPAHESKLGENQYIPRSVSSYSVPTFEANGSAAQSSSTAGFDGGPSANSVESISPMKRTLAEMRLRTRNDENVRPAVEFEEDLEGVRAVDLREIDGVLLGGPSRKERDSDRREAREPQPDDDLCAGQCSVGSECNSLSACGSTSMTASICSIVPLGEPGVLQMIA